MEDEEDFCYLKSLYQIGFTWGNRKTLDFAFLAVDIFALLGCELIEAM